MSILGLYAHMWYDEPDVDDQDDDAVCPPEVLSAGWWSVSADLDDED